MGFSGGEIGLVAELRGGVAKQTALHGRRKRDEARDVESEFGVESGRGGSATAADGPAGEQQLRRQPLKLGLPEGFFVAGQKGHLREMLAEARVEGVERGQQLVSNAVAGEGGVSIGGVRAPGLVEDAEIVLNLRARDGEERAKDWAALRAFKFWMNAGETLRPCAAQDFGEDGFSLVVEGVRGGDGVHLAGRHQLPKPGIAQASRGFFNGLRSLAGRGIGVGLGCRVYALLVKGNCQPRCQFPAKREILVGFGAAQSVVQMRRVEHQAQLRASSRQGAQQCHGIRSAGQPHRQARAGLQQGSVEGQIDGQTGPHQRIIRRQAGT